MPLSRFPRYGFRLAPTSLREVLELPLPRPFRSEAPSGALKLCDLDEHAWQKFSPEACVRLGQLVVETVRNAIPTLPMNVQRRLVPPPPEGMALEDLHLEQRTYNCLRRLLLEGRMTKVADLGQMAIGDFLSIEGFGAKCLVDLLTSLEALQMPKEARESQPEHEGTGPQREEDGSLRLLFSRIRHLRLPKLPEGATLADLTLATRTSNCLEKQGYFERPHDLEELTVEQVLEIPGFGMQSLMDYLAAIERFRNGSTAREADSSGAEEELLPLFSMLSGEHLFLEDELRALVSERSTSRAGFQMERNAGIVSEYLGLDGSGGATLKAIGDKYGLTRERVRQICDRTTHGLKRPSSVPPLL